MHSNILVYWQYMGIHAYTQQYMGMHGNMCQFKGTHGKVWVYMVIYSDTWQYMIIYGAHGKTWIHNVMSSNIFIVIYGHLHSNRRAITWQYMVKHGSMWAYHWPGRTQSNIIQLSPQGEVNSGGYIPRREASRFISTALHRP